MKAPVTVFVLTLNEEKYIQRCLSCLTGWAAEVLVVDSASTDRTQELAAAAGARVIVQPWLGWTGQHQAAMDAASYDWCFKVDADEVLDEELAESARTAILAEPDPRTGFVIERTEEFCSALMPNMRRREKRDSFVRLMHRKHSYYDPKLLIHEEVIVSGPRVRLPGKMLHWRDFSLEQRFAQYNKQTAIEAREMAAHGRHWSWMGLLGKPLLRFLWSYVWCGAWHAGMHGLVYSMSRASAEFMRQAKLWELQAVSHLRHPPRELYARAGGAEAGPAQLREG